MSLQVSRVLHAGYIFEKSNTRVIFDPIFENPFSHNCYAFPEIQFDVQSIRQLRFDAVFISHFHDDHCSLDSLNHLDRDTPIYIYCLIAEIPSLIQKLEFKSVNLLKLNHPIQIGEFKITPRRALDSDVDSLFQIETKDYNILNVVDSWIDWETLDLLKQQRSWDLILWPFQTMRELEVLSPKRFGFADPEIPSEWSEQLKILNPRALIPSSCQFQQESWSWYNSAFFPISYRYFEAHIKNILPEAQFFRLNPGQTLAMNGPSIEFGQSLPWIVPIGDQNVDYDYKQDLKVPSVAEIAKRFPQLNPEQSAVVRHFLQTGIVAVYRTLDVLESDYFSNKIYWELKVFSADGRQEQYFYEISDRNLKRVAEVSSQNVGWLTEISESKVFSALTDGESLTSIYIRINDIEFSAEIEAKLLDVDATMDPLVRCLFNRNPASYQQAQWSRLANRN